MNKMQNIISALLIILVVGLGLYLVTYAFSKAKKDVAEDTFNFYNTSGDVNSHNVVDYTLNFAFGNKEYLKEHYNLIEDEYYFYEDSGNVDCANIYDYILNNKKYFKKHYDYVEDEYSFYNSDGSVNIDNIILYLEEGDYKVIEQ